MKGSFRISYYQSVEFYREGNHRPYKESTHFQKLRKVHLLYRFGSLVRVGAILANIHLR